MMSWIHEEQREHYAMQKPLVVTFETFPFFVFFVNDHSE
jgi:hypothetical protein